MRDLHIFNELENNLNKLLIRYEDLKQSNKILEERISEQKQKLLVEKKKCAMYKEEYERVKVLNAMLGNNESKRLLKTKFNKIIKEVDSCILELKNKR